MLQNLNCLINLASFETMAELVKLIFCFVCLQDNQEREKTKHAKVKQGLEVERQANKALIKEGKKPVFISKAERKAKELVNTAVTMQNNYIYANPVIQVTPVLG